MLTLRWRQRRRPKAGSVRDRAQYVEIVGEGFCGTSWIVDRYRYVAKRGERERHRNPMIVISVDRGALQCGRRVDFYEILELLLMNKISLPFLYLHH